MPSVLDWQPNTQYGVDFLAISPFGEIIRCVTAHTSGAAGSYTTASPNWVVVSGRTQIGTTTAAAGANARTSPPAPVVTAGATDLRGNITAGTGTTPAAGAQVVVTFGRAFDAAPIVSLTAANAATEALAPAVISVSTTGFTISTNSAPAASQANTVYSYNYLATP